VDAQERVEMTEIAYVHVEEDAGTVTIKMDFVAAIGLYKMTLGFGDDDEDVLAVSAALQVNLAGVVGP
jgi:Cu/Ag efflux protein CusF